VTCVFSSRAGPDCFPGSSSQLPGHAAVREEPSCSARSRVAARTNELDADERRRIIGSEEGSFVLVVGVVGVPRRVVGGVVSQAPMGEREELLGGALPAGPTSGGFLVELSVPT
jgi:hypothetical protein